MSMKKILFIVPFLFYEPSVSANCNAMITWTISVKNNTGAPLTISCPNQVIADGMTSVPQKVISCNGSHPTCTYTKQDGTTGTLQIKMTSCTQASPNVSPTVSPPYAFGCSPVYPKQETIHTYCDGYVQYTNYNVAAYFTVEKERVSYDLQWNDVHLSLEEGQVVATKLASDLKASFAGKTSVPFNDYIARYNGHDLFISFIALPTDPYTQAVSESDCKAITTKP